MSVVGIDLSSKAIHVAVLEEDTNDASVHIVRLDAQRGDSTTRIRRMRDLMPRRTAYQDLGVTLIALEQPLGQFTKVTLMVYGALLQLLPADLPLLELRADDWRRECALPIRGDRDTLKAASKQFARSVWTNAPPVFDDNVAEAVLIAYAAREIDLRRGLAAA